MTRSRSVLALFGVNSEKQLEQDLLEAVEQCYDALKERPKVELAASASDELEDLLAVIGEKHKSWLRKLNQTHRLVHEPMLNDDQTILCEPLFWFETERYRYACFPEGKPSQRVRYDVEDAGVKLLIPGRQTDVTSVSRRSNLCVYSRHSPPR